MATALLSPPPSVSTSSSSLYSTPSLHLSHINNNVRNRRSRLLGRNGLTIACSAKHTSGFSFQRRGVMLLTLSSSASLLLPSPALSGSESQSEEDAKMEIFVDDTNAYSFLYPCRRINSISNEPTQSASVMREEADGLENKVSWVEHCDIYKFTGRIQKTRRYSSAAPLSPDARLRIVSERVDMIHNVFISVSIGPSNPSYLTSNFKDTWGAKDVADSVLSDKSSLRVTTSQCMQESSVLDAHASEIDGEPYWYYEYIVRKSPTTTVPESNLFRHFVASTAERDGYLYTLNASTLSKQWELMGPFLKQTVASFRLLPPTEKYVPPFKDPWRFW